MKRQEASSNDQNQKFEGVFAKALATVRTYGLIILIAGLICLAAGLAWLAINRQMDLWSRLLLIGGLALVAMYALLRPDEIQSTLTGRSVRYGSNVLISSLAAVGIVVLLNVLSTRYYKRVDVTQAGLHSLSPQSIQVLERVNVDIEMIGFYPSGQGKESFEKWIAEYRAHTPYIRYLAIDPIRQPGEADQLGWDVYGAGLLIQRGDRSFRVTRADEQDITSAILKIVRDTEPKIYFLTGHGEPSPTAYDALGYGQISQTLVDNGYEIETLNLAITDTVPSDASMVVVAGLQSELLQQEQERLTRYLLRGGKGLFLVDPGPETGVNQVLAPWEISVENKVVIDPVQSLSGDPLTPVINGFEFSQITKDLENMLVALPIAAPIQRRDLNAEPAETDVSYTPLALTSSRAWAESDTESTEARYDQGTDLAGPLVLAASVQSPAGIPTEGDEEMRRTRIVVVGDSDFVANDVLSQIPNGQYLILNAINWLTEEQELIAIGPKSYQSPTIRLSAIQEGVVCFGSLILIPAVIVIAGAIVWLKRR